MKKLYPVILLALITLIACNRDNGANETEIITAFIEDNNLVGEYIEDGIFLSIENPGNGAMPTAQDRVQVYYEGQYASDGRVFDGNLSAPNPISFGLQQVIRGWTTGLQYFGVGDKGWLVIPSNQAYGNNPPPGIRNNAPLAFYIELVGIN
jgi:FKBP-type peptidyl-prolyl cis-trans isomerase FkpA